MSFPSKIELSPAVDFHVHLRDGAMMKTVVPTIKKGGVDTVYVMPNLVPPVTTISAALEYKKRLQELDSSVDYLMTLYLEPSITPEDIEQAAKAGIYGLKAYPAGVTTNSDAGVVNYEIFYPIFAAMEKHDLVLNLHGEVPSTSPKDFTCDSSKHGEAITVLNAEPRFLPTLLKIHRDFPNLRIVLEHCTTADAVETVNACGPNVTGTITAHHLWITIDEVAGDAFNFCKPIAKTPRDRLALLKAVVEGGKTGKFFFGSDSAPHPFQSKTGIKKAAAGCFTQGWCAQLVVGALEEAVAQGWLAKEEATPEAIDEFLSQRGRAFYKLGDHPSSTARIILEKENAQNIPDIIKGEEGIEVVPFRRGQTVWNLTWKA
ncbi:hypothetical protein KEM56_001374 [Ascosphaera pollenicola]|nr:hypothetical protein KEM56_001374 [Ascosphaera pollenicola]